MGQCLSNTRKASDDWVDEIYTDEEGIEWEKHYSSHGNPYLVGQQSSSAPFSEKQELLLDLDEPHVNATKFGICVNLPLTASIKWWYPGATVYNASKIRSYTFYNDNSAPYKQRIGVISDVAAGWYTFHTPGGETFTMTRPTKGKQSFIRLNAQKTSIIFLQGLV